MSVQWAGGQIRIGFSTVRRNIFSRLIRAFQKSDVSHTWLLLDDALFDVDMVMEASDFGFRLIPYERFKRKNDIVQVITPIVPIDGGVRDIIPLIGSHYDYLGLFGMIVVYIGRWLKRKWNNPFHSPNSVFCSESITKVLKLSNYPGSDVLGDENTAPNDVRKFLLEHNLNAGNTPQLE